MPHHVCGTCRALMHSSDVRCLFVQSPCRGCAHWDELLSLREHQSHGSLSVKTATPFLVLPFFFLSGALEEKTDGSEWPHVSSDPISLNLPTARGFPSALFPQRPAPLTSGLVSLGVPRRTLCHWQLLVWRIGRTSQRILPQSKPGNAGDQTHTHPHQGHWVARLGVVVSGWACL